MPWRESTVMEERLRFVARRLEGESMTGLCREFGISRKTGHELFARWKAHGLEALADRPRKPGRVANRPPMAVEAAIVGLRKEKPHWGRASSASCSRAGSERTCPSPPARRSTRCSTATAWSSMGVPGPRGHGHAAVPAGRSERRVVRRLQRRVPARQRPALLSVDRHRSGFPLHPPVRSLGGNGGRVPFSPHSTGCPRSAACRSRSAPTVEPEVRLWRNGVPFASRGLYGLSRLSVWWLRLGIGLERTPAGPSRTAETSACISP